MAHLNPLPGAGQAGQNVWTRHLSLDYCVAVS